MIFAIRRTIVVNRAVLRSRLGTIGSANPLAYSIGLSVCSPDGWTIYQPASVFSSTLNGGLAAEPHRHDSWEVAIEADRSACLIESFFADPGRSFPSEAWGARHTISHPTDQ